MLINKDKVPQNIQRYDYDSKESRDLDRLAHSGRVALVKPIGHAILRHRLIHRLLAPWGTFLGTRILWDDRPAEEINSHLFSMVRGKLARMFVEAQTYLLSGVRLNLISFHPFCYRKRRVVIICISCCSRVRSRDMHQLLTPTDWCPMSVLTRDC